MISIYSKSDGSFVTDLTSNDSTVESNFAAQFSDVDYWKYTEAVTNPSHYTFDGTTLNHIGAPYKPDHVVKIVSPVSSAKNAAFTVSVSVVDANDNDALVDVTETYYIPLKNAMSGDIDQIITLPIANGAGSVDITVATAGIYDIAEQYIRPRPTARIAETVDIVIT